MVAVASPGGTVFIWSQTSRGDSQTLMLADGVLVEDSWLRAEIISRAAEIALRGRPTVLHDQTAHGRRGWSTLDLEMTTVDGSRASLGFLMSSKAPPNMGRLVDEYLTQAGLTMDAESQRQAGSAEQALCLASRPGCLGALT